MIQKFIPRPPPHRGEFLNRHTSAKSRRRRGGLAFRPIDAAVALILLALAWAIVTRGAGGETPPANLARDPLNTTALRSLGLGFAGKGDMARADALLSFVGRRTWRDGPASGWLLTRRLEQGRFAEAMDQADALLRRDPGESAQTAIFPVLTLAAAYDDPRGTLIERLSLAPWWRTNFLQFLANRGDPSASRAVLLGLRACPHPPTAEEVAPFLAHRIAARDFAGALRDWRALSPSACCAGALIRNGDFTAATDNTPFTWSRAEGAGATSDVTAAPDLPGTRALRVDYDGSSSPDLPKQLLVLPPGSYRLTWRQRVEATEAADRLGWTVRCAEDQRLLAARPAARSGGGTIEVLDVTVPDSGCQGQWLQLSPSPGDRRSSMTLWSWAFRLEPIV